MPPAAIHDAASAVSGRFDATATPNKTSAATTSAASGNSCKIISE
jgi:hypothetical protein